MTELSSDRLTEYYKEIKYMLERRRTICEELSLLTCEFSLEEMLERITNAIQIKLFQEWEEKEDPEKIENMKKVVSIGK